MKNVDSIIIFNLWGIIVL